MDKREGLKATARGIDVFSFEGMPIKFWLILESGEYNRDVINCCKGIISKYNQETGKMLGSIKNTRLSYKNCTTKLRKGAFIEYLRKHE